ncbi:MAG: radical SAM protein [Firmicutes bacterium]|nr:radical SAM protein [Bacillota bacterium]
MEKSADKKLIADKIAAKSSRRGQNPAVFTCQKAGAVKTPKASILPYFIPMEGCPNACIFCEQKQISSHSESPAPERIAEDIEKLNYPHELAFYGGSFSMLPKEKQLYYLKAAAKGIAEGKISAIRISTRPDSIDEEELTFLWGNGVRTIELGIQSLDAEVLHTAGRFYDEKTVFASAKLVKEKGFSLGLQLMPGLPQANYEKDMTTAQKCLAIQPDFVRIYPTLVIAHTKLADMYRKGIYEPLTLAEAVCRCRDIAAVFMANDIPIIRMGLHNTQSLQEGLLAGPFDEAFGAFVYSALAAEHMKQLQALTKCQSITANKSYLPLLFGHKGCNQAWIKEHLPNGLHGSTELQPKCIATENSIFSEKDFLLQYIDKISTK